VSGLFICHILAVCGVSSEDNEGGTAIDRERARKIQQQEKWRQETLLQQAKRMKNLSKNCIP
jgi:hypothetical protein